jgi:hypothetical protein
MIDYDLMPIACVLHVRKHELGGSVSIVPRHYIVEDQKDFHIDLEKGAGSYCVDGVVINALCLHRMC